MSLGREWTFVFVSVEMIFNKTIKKLSEQKSPDYDGIKVLKEDSVHNAWGRV